MSPAPLRSGNHGVADQYTSNNARTVGAWLSDSNCDSLNSKTVMASLMALSWSRMPLMVSRLFIVLGGFQPSPNTYLRARRESSRCRQTTQSIPLTYNYFSGSFRNTSTVVEVLITLVVLLPVPSLSVCAFVSVRVPPSDEIAKWLTSSRLRPAMLSRLTISKVEPLLRLKDREIGPRMVGSPSSLTLVSS